MIRPLLCLAVVAAALVAVAPAARAQPVPTPEPPPTVWTEWDIVGTFLESPREVRAALEPELKARRALTAKAKAELRDVCAKLGYELVSLSERAAAGGTRVTLQLEPLVVVRWVDIRVRQRAWDVLLDDEIRRRLQLRAGTALPYDAEARRQLIEEEVERLKAFLHDEGFFEATVEIIADREGEYGALVRVNVDLKESYKLGKVTIKNQSTDSDLAVPRAEILAAFDRGFFCIAGRCRFTHARHQADVDRVTEMFQRRGYPSVRVETDFNPLLSFDRHRKKVDVNITIDQRRKLDVVFEGNDKDLFPDDQLQKQLTFAGAGAADDVEVASSARAIERYYQTKGYFDVIVTAERVRLDTFDRVVYRIEPGAVRSVKSVDIACRAADDTRRCSVPRKELDAALGTTGEGRALTAQLAADVLALTRVYRGQGFQSAVVRVEVAPTTAGWQSSAVTAAQVLAGDRPKDLHVRYVIDEGPRSVIEAIHVTFEGHPATRGEQAREQQVRRRLRIAPGDDHVPDKLAAAARDLQEWYRALGRPHATVTVEPPEPGTKPNGVVLTIDVEERHEVRLGEVIIRGNFRTKEWVIREELGLRTGQLVTDDVIAGGPRRLRATNLFDSVDLKLLGIDEQDSQRDVVHGVLRVVERDDVFDELDLEGGGSRESGIFVRAKPRLPNVGGLGIRVEAALTLGTQYQAVELSGRLPRWLAHRAIGARFDTELSAFLRNQSTERFGDLFTAGASVAGLRSWQVARTEDHGARLVTAAVRYDFRLRSRDEELVRPAGLAGDLTTNPIRTRTGTVGVTLGWDQRRDARGDLNPLAPDHGFRLEGSAAFAHPYLVSQDTFVKVNGLAQVLHTFGRLQLRGDARYDQGIPLGGAVLLPEVERFFAGGDDTVRGFEEDRMSTEIIEEPVPPLGQTTQIRVLPAGGNIRTIASLDGQVTVWRLGGYAVASALFVDAGLITNTWTTVGLDDIRPAAGSAVRWLLPVGAASIEYAVPLTLHTGDNPRGRLHFALALRY